MKSLTLNSGAFCFVACSDVAYSVVLYSAVVYGDDDMPSKIIVKQSTISALMLGILVFVAILLGSSILFMSSSIKDEQTAEKRRTEFKQLGIDLADASDYLTDEARKFAVTRDETHMYKYWVEINITKTRDNVIAKLEELNSPSEEKALLAEAKMNSDALVATERHSMRLVLDALAVPEEEMPPEVASFQLSAEDHKLTPEAKMTKARDIMFDEKYDLDKKSIMEPIAKFQQTMNARLEAELEIARKATDRAKIMQAVLALMIICAVAILLRILFTQVTYPIRNYTEMLKVFSFSNENFSLVPQGSLELRMLAGTFNNLYQSFQEELVKRKQAEDKMKVAKEEAEKANNAKSEFLANMSHEIRTPLNTIVGYHYLLNKTEYKGKQKDYLRNLGMAAKSLLGIINEILDFSKIEAGRMTLEALEFNLHETIREVCNMVRLQAENKGLVFRCVIQPDVPEYTKGDATRLKQVILNLLANGIKFTEQGSLEISVEVVQLQEKEIELGFKVKDTGIGIAEDQIKNLFRKFTQGDASTSRKYGGTGLGLAICKKFVELMAGEIKVSSIPGKGSVFSFTVKLEHAAQLPLPASLNEDNLSQVRFTAKKILMTEDNEINLLMTKEILESLGFLTDTALNGQIAVKMAAAAQYDAILMDIRMPEMDGYEATRRILEMLGAKAPPVIALSADAVEGVAEKAKLAGMSGYLTKPLEPVKLIEVLKQFVGLEMSPDGLPAEEAAASVPGQQWLDFTGGIRRLGGREKEYKQILEKFLENHQNDAAGIRKLLARGDSSEANRLLHTLKGVAANIGADQLKEGSLRLKKALDSGDEVRISEEQKHFTNILAETCQSAAGFIAGFRLKDKVTRSQKRDIYREIAKLIKLLEEGDADAAALFASCNFLENELAAWEYRQLNKKIASYNFEEAAVLLKAYWPI